MSDTPEAEAEAPEAGEAKVKNNTNVRGWASSGGPDRSRTFTYESGEKAVAAARRALRTFRKANRPLGVKLEGAELTLRVYPVDGVLDEKLINLMKRRSPKAKAKKVARRAKAQQESAGEATEG